MVAKLEEKVNGSSQLIEWARQSTPQLIGENLRAGLALFWRAYLCAQDTGVNVWEFALSAARLHDAGMTDSDLQWMIAKGFAEHGEEILGSPESHRTFLLKDGYVFDHRSRLILTPNGANLAAHVFQNTTQTPQTKFAAMAVAAETAALANEARTHRNTASNMSLPPKPYWDTRRRELSLAGLIVKRYRVPARNQETILSVFEEEGWAEHIHDPLPVTHEIDAPTRLHDAINRLNRCQIHPLLRFHGDGKGTGVFWELRQPVISG